MGHSHRFFLWQLLPGGEGLLDPSKGLRSETDYLEQRKISAYPIFVSS